jgi:hypothetical protein
MTIPEAEHRIVETNGIRMHVAEQGTGPRVRLCHCIAYDCTAVGFRTCAAPPPMVFGIFLAGAYGGGSSDSVLGVSFCVAALVWYAPAWFTQEKSALHDLLSGTRVRVGRV